MAKKRKSLKLTDEDRARFDETTRRLRARIAERERIEAELEAAAKQRAQEPDRSS
jgi:hypothetical protein